MFPSNCCRLEEKSFAKFELIRMVKVMGNKLKSSRVLRKGVSLLD